MKGGDSHWSVTYTATVVNTNLMTLKVLRHHDKESDTGKLYG